MRTVHNFKQGDDAWHAHRRASFNASEAPVVMGVSPYQTRSDLLQEKAIGNAAEVSAGTQALFDRGHDYEAIARPWAEEIIGTDLYPIVASLDVDGLPLSASYDGATMDEDVIFEHKTANKDLLEALNRGEIPSQYRPQMEQQLLILGAKRCLFMASAGDQEAMRFAWYESDPQLRAMLLAAWQQFKIDLANYQHVEHIPAAVATPTMALPALSIQVNGSISLIDNLALFGEKLTEFIGNVNREPDTDEDFANLEAAVKTLQTAQDALEAAESSALAQTASIDEMRRTVAMYAKLARDNRLMFKKLVDAKKESLRAKIVGEGVMALREHIDGLNKRLGKSYMPTVSADFSGAAKGKRTITSLRSAVSDELARAKIAASAVADGIQVNLNTLRELAKDHAFLFADAGAIVLKAPDDLTALVKLRIAEHQAAEQKRLDAEREKIRAEEAEKLARQQAAQVAPPPTATPAIAPVAAQPAPIIAPPAWGGGVPKKVQRPPDAAIIRAVAQAFGVDDETAMDWVSSMDFSELAA